MRRWPLSAAALLLVLAAHLGVALTDERRNHRGTHAMKTVIDTAKPVRIADVAPGDVFRLADDDTRQHVRIDGNSPHLAMPSGRLYSLCRGRIVAHEPDATGLVVDLSRVR
jgi:hypothetical protein